MFKTLFNVIKRWVIWIATSQLIGWYKNKKTFKEQFDNAQWIDKLKIAREYLISVNKEHINKKTVDERVESAKNMFSQKQEELQALDKKIKTLDTHELIDQWTTKVRSFVEKVASATQSVGSRGSKKIQEWFNDIMIKLHEKINTIEWELSDFESRSLTYGEETRKEYYRQLASKLALLKKTALKHISQGVLVAEEQFDLENKIKYMSEKLEELKSNREEEKN